MSDPSASPARDLWHLREIAATPRLCNIALLSVELLVPLVLLQLLVPLVLVRLVLLCVELLGSLVLFLPL